MGSNNSKPEQDAATIWKEFKHLEQFSGIIDFATTLKYVTANLLQKIADLSAVAFSQGEQEEFDALELRKLTILRDIRTFVTFINLQVLSIKTKIWSRDLTPNSVKFHDMKYGPERAPVGLVLSQQAAACMALAEEYNSFGKRLQQKHVMGETARKVCGSILVIGGVLGAAALLFFTVGAAAPLVISAAAIGSAVAVVGAITVGAIMVSPSEVERATAYLKKVGGDLAHISLRLDDIIPAYEEDNRQEVMENIEYVLRLTNEISLGVEKAINARFG